MAEILDDTKSEELERKLRSRTRVRGLLIAANLLLVGYLCYSVTDAIIALVRNTRESENYVSICGRSERGSKRIYDQFVTNPVQGDFMSFDDSLVITNGIYNKDEKKSFNNIQLVNVCSATQVVRSVDRYENMGDYVNDGINLFSDNASNRLEEGDYIFYGDYVSWDDKKTIDIDIDRNIKQVHYSSPNENGIRVKTTLYAYKNNPALVMNVSYEENVEDDYYDFIIKNDNAMSQFALTKLRGLGLKARIETSEDDTLYYKANTPKIIEFTLGESEALTVNERVDITGFAKVSSEFNTELLGYALASGNYNDLYSDHPKGKLVVTATYSEASLTDSNAFLAFIDSLI